MVNLRLTAETFQGKNYSENMQNYVFMCVPVAILLYWYIYYAVCSNCSNIHVASREFSQN